MVKLRLLLEYSEFRASQEQKIRGRARALSLSLYRRSGACHRMRRQLVSFTPFVPLGVDLKFAIDPLMAVVSCAG